MAGSVTLRLAGIELIGNEGTPPKPSLRFRYAVVSQAAGEVPIQLTVPAQANLTAAEAQARKALQDWADDLHNACQSSPLPP